MPTDSLPNKPAITVVILAYNSGEFMAGCLDALSSSRGVELEIICVDNASTDRSHEIAREHPATTRAIRSEENLGFSGGNNLALPHVTHPLIVFINPDCRIMPDTLFHLVAPLLKEETVGATGARLLYPNTNRIQHAGGILHPNAMGEHHGTNEEDGEKFHHDLDVDFVTGALIAFRTKDFRRLGGFDPEYWPAYYEETDLCWRLRQEGRRIRYVAGAVAYHWESPGLVKMSRRFVATSYRSRMVFLVKNYKMGDWFTRFLPFEAKWFVGPFARGFRIAVLRSYLSGSMFALKCLLRFSRRPRGRSITDQANS
ncbi:MAG: glycosyltransferase family 2 protein [Candidatus Sumerlaeia bacterium]|nr:glycosyltransferase family 2 protein [Candidatus Sumerlaeia bacterium]